MGHKPRTIAERFENLYAACPMSGCWLWLGCTDGKGYPAFTIMGKIVPAHRFSWEMHNKASAKGGHVLHKCDVPVCVNPAHLFIGTQADNSLDMKQKGRSCYGERNPHSKLTIEAVRDIRRRALMGEASRAIAQSYGIAPAHVRNVVTRKTWKHVQ